MILTIIVVLLWFAWKVGYYKLTYAIMRVTAHDTASNVNTLWNCSAFSYVKINEKAEKPVRRFVLVEILA